MKFFAIISVVLFAAVSSRAIDQLVVADFSLGVDERGVPTGWQLKEKSGRADFAVKQVDGLHALHLRSTDTSFSFQREIKADLRQYPILSWKWKVTKLPEGGDFRRTRTDDQAAQLFVAFNKTQTIVYIWDTTAPKGLMEKAPSPPLMSIRAVVVRSSSNDLGKWLAETRNVFQDYQQFFGKTDKPLFVSGMRIQINTQHTGTAAESYFGDVAFKPDSTLKDAANQ